jgi:hypothetical protein
MLPAMGSVVSDQALLVLPSYRDSNEKDKKCKLNHSYILISNTLTLLFSEGRIFTMLYTIALVLLVLWVLGLVSSYTIGGFIHILLVVAVVIILLRVISGRKPL